MVVELTTFAQQYGKDIVLAVLGILGGGIISFFFYRRSLLREEVSFACEYTRLIWSRIPAFSNITLSHQGEQLHDPRRVLFYIWNSGNTTIEGSKIATADPVRLASDTVRIINAAVVRSTRDVICANVELQNNGDVKIEFDYLDAGDGFVVETLYDVIDKENPNTCPDLLGTLKGIKNSPVSREVAFENRALKRFGQSTALILTLLVSIILLVFQTYEIAETSSWLLIIPKILTGVLLLLLAVGMVIALIFTLRSYRIPMKLKVSADDTTLPSLPSTYIELVERLDQTNARLASQTTVLQKEATALGSNKAD